MCAYVYMCVSEEMRPECLEQAAVVLQPSAIVPWCLCRTCPQRDDATFPFLPACGDSTDCLLLFSNLLRTVMNNGVSIGS